MLADATTQYVRVGWTAAELVQVIGALVTLVAALTALAKAIGLETKHKENAREIQVTNDKIEEVKTAAGKAIEEVKNDVRTTQTDIKAVMLATPPAPIVPTSLQQVMREGQGQ